MGCTLAGPPCAGFYELIRQTSIYRANKLKQKMLVAIGVLLVAPIVFCGGCGILIGLFGSTGGPQRPKQPETVTKAAPTAPPPASEEPEQKPEPTTAVEKAEASLVDVEQQQSSWLAANPKPEMPQSGEHLFVDASGAFSVKATVQRIDQNQIALIKADGSGTATVPISKLCEFDQKYLDRTFGEYLPAATAWQVENDRLATLVATAKGAVVEAHETEERIVQDAKDKAAAAEREIAAAASAKKASEQAAKDAVAGKAQHHLNDSVAAYKTLLEATGAGALITGLKARYVTGDVMELTLVVSNLWHIRHKQIRLQDAQNLWEAWATLASRDAPDNARLKIEDQNGNQVGGSRWIAGSVIYVDD